MNQTTDTQQHKHNKIISGIIIAMLSLSFFSFFFLSPRFPLETPPDKPWMATSTEEDWTEALEIHDIILNFRPAIIGDPITGAEYRYVVKSACWTAGALTAIDCATVSCLFMKKRKQTSRKKKIKFIFFCTILPASLVFTVCYAASYYFGGPYNYGNYAIPTEASDIVIWFSGSDDGAYFMDNYARSIHEFGYNRTALFNFKDIAQALFFVEQLPSGCRIIVRGHSMGASAAFHFAQKCNREILLLDTRDPTSWFNHPKAKPPNVVHWRNVLPGESALRVPESRHLDTNYFFNYNLSNLFRNLGAPWGCCNGAVNLLLTGFDHHDVGENID